MYSIHQVNHPGKELNISYKYRLRNKLDYYFFPNSQIKGVRLWNRCFVNGKSNSHKRKFIEFKGKYVTDLHKPLEKNGLLRFWGEYEGHSEFKLLNFNKNIPYWDSPIAIHYPFFCEQIINDQNTDPYLFGDNIYYSICKKSNLKNLDIGDIIIFGSEFGKKGEEKFFLDTIFVVKEELPSTINNIYKKQFIESTLKRIGLSGCTSGTLPIHLGKRFVDNKNYFSFFPARISHHEKNGFGRPTLLVEKYGLQKPGARTGAKSIKFNSYEEHVSIWKKIAQEVLDQGFVLGTFLDSIPIKKYLPKS